MSVFELPDADPACPRRIHRPHENKRRALPSAEPTRTLLFGGLLREVGAGIPRVGVIRCRLRRLILG